MLTTYFTEIKGWQSTPGWDNAHSIEEVLEKQGEMLKQSQKSRDEEGIRLVKIQENSRDSTSQIFRTSLI